MLSYKSVVGHYHLSDSQLREKCNEKVLEALAPKLGEWRDIRPHLGVDRNVGTAIEHDQPTEEAKRRQLLYRWKQINGHQATYEKLIRALMQASRTDLAGTVCEIYASTEVDTCNQTHTPVADDVKPGSHPFTSPHPDPAINDDSESSSRNIPLSLHESSQTLRQRNVQGMQEVGNNPLVVEPRQIAAAVPKNTTWGFSSLQTREKDENEQSLENKVKELEKQVHGILESRKNQMENREKELEKSLTEKDEMISGYKKDLCQAQSELDSEMRKHKETEKDWEQNEKKIEWLQNSVYQKEREMGQERDEKEEKSSELERQKKENEIMKEELDQLSTRIETLQKHVEYLTSKVMENDVEKYKILMEMEKAKEALVRTKQELDDEKRANSELNSKLAQLQKYITIFQVSLIVLLAFFAAFFLHSRNLFFMS